MSQHTNGIDTVGRKRAGSSAHSHDADLARLLRAASELHSADSEEGALRVVCAAMRDTGWGRVSAYAYTPDWQISAAAFIGLDEGEVAQLRDSRASVAQRQALFGPSRAPFRISRSYLIPAERRDELVNPTPFIRSHRSPPSETSCAWNPQDIAYTPLYGADGTPIGLVMYDDPVSEERPDQEAFRYIEFFADAAARVIEQMRTTERLRRIEYRLGALLESMPDVVFYEGDEAPRLISRNLQALLGISAEEVQRSPEGLTGLLDPRDAERVRARRAQWERDGAHGTLIIRARMRTAQGDYRWIEDRAVRLPGADLDKPHRAGVMIDVTEQVETEEALREREERFHMVTLATRDTIYDWNLVTGEVWRNEALEQIVGERASSESADWWRDRIHPDDRDHVEASLTTAMKNASHWGAEYRIRRKDGSYAHVQDRGFLVRNEEGRVVRITGAMSDITARKQAEERQVLMVRELDHRVKNNLATVSVLAQQTLRAAPNLQQFERTFSGRLRALARTHSVLAQSQGLGAPLGGIVRQTLEPYTLDEPRRLIVSGEDVMLPARMAAPLALALNELATNAVKYGALSVPQGWVGVAWNRIEDPKLGAALRIEWSEHGGPPVEPPTTQGFGTTLIADEAKFQLRGRAEMHYEPRGVRCLIVAPLQAPAGWSETGQTDNAANSNGDLQVPAAAGWLNGNFKFGAGAVSGGMWRG